MSSSISLPVRVRTLGERRVVLAWGFGGEGGGERILDLHGGSLWLLLCWSDLVGWKGSWSARLVGLRLVVGCFARDAVTEVDRRQPAL